jgi:hypothetical protein
MKEKIKILNSYLEDNNFKKESEILKKAYLTNEVNLLRDLIRFEKSDNQNYLKGQDVANADIFLFFNWLEKNDYLKSEDEKDYSDIDPEDYSNFYEEYYKSSYWGKMDASDLPACVMMHYERIVKDEWLVHFTDYAYDISIEGFKYGAPDPSGISYTRYYSDRYRQQGSGYNFAFLATDRANITGKKYGKEAVLFKANGILVYHFGDDEHQVIFLGSTARDIIPIVQDGYSGLKVGNFEHKKFDNFWEAVKWTTANFNQYRRVILGD